MQVEIWSDIVCPWCYIGKRRFETALAAFDGREEVSVRFRSFELAPERVSSVDETVDQMLASRYGVSLERARAMNERVSIIAAGEGLDYHLERARPSNTFDAHRVTHLAMEVGLQDPVVERLHAGYFTEGAAIGDHAELGRLAAEAGMDPDVVQDTLMSGRFADEVRADEALARQLGVSGVPFFVIDRRYGVSGAQGADVLLGALEQARGELALAD